MTLTILIVAAALFAAAAFARHTRITAAASEAAAPREHRRAVTARPRKRAADTASQGPPAPPLAMIEWEPQAASSPPAPILDAAQAAGRDRYLAARFPGVIAGGIDLEAPATMIRAARDYFDAGHADLAQELLELAGERAPREKSLRLARLEMAFVQRDGEGFLALAREFRAAFPAGREWADVERLGRALMPGEGFFGSRSPIRSHEHHGPWPEIPNWLAPSCDLGAEVAAAEFHAAMARAHRADARRRQAAPETT